MKRPIRSPQGLTTCPTCRRHIVAAERPSLTVCPFCPSPKPRGRGGMLAASILALGLTACGGSQSEDGAPPDDTHQTDDTGGGEAAPPDDDGVDDAPPPEESDSDDQDSRFDDGDENRAVALYGVAPE